ncbi:NADPH:quinone oxidoreductase family protein [Ramlibacter tataouinensis]|uniref:NADPH:quinone oxidoreductase family protein n=1 Tax=Ramlibacter tataouinensis TaxID=94132 RepID=UPI0022F3FAD9|nr:NADPH:quinone oxidoreductase family protein [Ramlibacter tataouinensis]WBY01072.1 NADPH:quinone oxidoreductase family protein [Ramlibacter tataouinensis]
MKAIVCHAYGPLEALRWERAELPQVGRGEVKIAVHAAGVNFADTLKVQGKHQVKPPLPWTPGAEVAGLVLEVGEGVEQLQAGDRVLGVPDDQAGGYAEAIVLRADRVLRLPAGLSMEKAAALPAAYGTALYALKQRGRVAAGDRVLVLGAAGGVGLAAVQVAVAMGARVIAAASTPGKRDLASQHGASACVDYTKPEWRKEVLDAAGPAGIQAVFDPVGGDLFDEAVRTVGWDGRYLVVGFAAGRIPELKMNHPLVKGYDVVGIRYDVWRDRFWAEARENLEQVLVWCAEGRVRPVVARTEPLPRAVEALMAIAGREVVGKLVLTAPAAA